MNDELQEVSVILATAREELKKTISDLAVQRNKLEDGESRLLSLDKERQDKIKQNEELSKTLEMQYSDLRVQLDSESAKRKEEREEVLRELQGREEKLRETLWNLAAQIKQGQEKLQEHESALSEVLEEYGKQLKKNKELESKINSLETLEIRKKSLENDVILIGQEKDSKTKSLDALNKDILTSTEKLQDLNQKLLALDDREANISHREKFHEEKKQNFIHIAKQLAAVYDKPEAMKYLTKFL